MATASTDLATLTNVKTYLGISGEDDDTLLGSLIDRVSQAIETQAGRIFGSTSITSERHDGNGSTRLRLKRYPVSTVDRLSIGVQNCMDITNVSATSGASHAYVRVSSTALLLTLVGGDNAGTDAPGLANYVTMTALIAVINALGTGWVATADDTDTASYPATDLLPTYGRFYALDETVDLVCPEEPETDFTLDDENAGIVYCGSGFTVGNRNIVVDYTAGYSAVPDDIAHAAILWVAAIYNRAKEGADGFKSENIPELSQTYLHTMPAETKDVLDAYREILI